MLALPQALAALAQYPQFICYYVGADANNPDKLVKMPLDYRTGSVSNAHDPNIWTGFETASRVAQRNGWGVGFVVTRDDPFFFIDIDACYDATTQQWSSTAQRLLAACAGAAVEVSSSGRGLHIIGKGQAPAHRCKNEIDGTKIEMYTESRFIALTGTNMIGNAETDLTDRLPGIVGQFFPLAHGAENGVTDWTSTPRADWNGSTDDEELITRAIKSRSARAIFGNSATFADLWYADAPALSKAFPANNAGDLYDASSADAALAQHLSFWTGCNCERIKSLMLQSALVRPKWERESYINTTIQKACARQVDVLKDNTPTLPLENPTDETFSPPRGVLTTGNTMLTPAQQVEMFAGCVYVRDAHAVLIPGGTLLKPDQFRVMLGGYSFILDNRNEKTTRDPWKAFSENQAVVWPKVHTVCFRPDLKPGAIIENEGVLMANIWWPVKTSRKQGDMTRFTEHLNRLIPDETDRIKLVSYMAACVQYPGIKFQWCPLIQGAQGNGKTLFTRCVAAAIGYKYTHFPKASEITARFNDWLYGNIFIGVEDIYVADAPTEVLEILKPMITSEYQEVEPKGGKKLTREICCNFILNSNHKNAIRKTKDDRRFAIFYTAQQTAEDVERDGMGGNYFPEMYAWLRAEGYAIVSEFLYTYQIPDEYNPATRCHRAPETTSTSAAIHSSMGTVEQEVLEAIGSDVAGFRNGWVSSIALNTLLEKIRAGRRVPHNKRREFMQNLGYDYHPALTDGRVNTPVMPDGGKPRLYCAQGHTALGLSSPGDVAKAYQTAQNLNS